MRSLQQAQGERQQADKPQAHTICSCCQVPLIRAVASFCRAAGIKRPLLLNEEESTASKKPACARASPPVPHRAGAGYMAAAAAPAATPDRSLSRSLSFGELQLELLLPARSCCLASPRSREPLSADVGTLRAAASAAVAECTGGKGLGVHSTQRDPHPALERPSDGSVQSKLSSLTSGGDIATTEGVTQGTGSLSLVDDEHSGKSSDSQLHLTKAQLHEALNACPPHGAKAICGRRPRMEDAYTAVPFLLEVPVPADTQPLGELIPSRIATHIRSAGNSPAVSEHDEEQHQQEPGAAHGHRHGSPVGQQQAPAAVCKEGPSNSVMETLHFFGVFDGHGGAEAALHCAQTLHQRIAEALSAVSSPSAQSKIAESFAASQVDAQLSAGIRQASGICKCPGEKCTCGLRHPKSGGPCRTGELRLKISFEIFAHCQYVMQWFAWGLHMPPVP